MHLETAIEMQRQMVDVNVKVIWDCCGEGLPKMIQYIHNVWSPSLYLIQNCDEYGFPFRTIPPFDSKDEDTSILWIISALFTRR